MFISSVRLCTWFLAGMLVPPTHLFAAGAEQLDGWTVEEIIVTARRQEETLQDVPVTVAALTEQDLDRYNITTLVEASELVPNFLVFHGTGGSGSNLVLRGIGSSSISAAFDQSLAINVDGVVVNVGRFIHNAYMDMGQFELLKGPQSLYFGKSATAGVMSVTTNDPGDEAELEAMVGYEIEHDQRYLEFILSGPISDTIGARLAVGHTRANKLFENLAPDVHHQFRGEQALNGRLTLVWQPNERFHARLKYSYSEYKNDGANGRIEEICPEGTVQPTVVPNPSFPLAAFQGVDDCKLNGNTSNADLHPDLRAGMPYGADNGVPFLDQDTHFIAAKFSWHFTDYMSITSVTGYADLEHIELDSYDFSAGVFGAVHRNVYESVSQEFQFASEFDGPLNFMAGLHYQDAHQVFNAYQVAFNLGILVGPDPATGRAYDYNKNHYLDTEAFSGFLAGYWNITEFLELTTGLRYTHEQKDGYITVPYLHVVSAFFGFGTPPLIEGLEFEDDNVSPEVALSWHVTPDITLYASYKEGFKSGGVDNSALPTRTLDPNRNPDFPDFLIYDSEKASGFEGGMKASLLNGGMRFNASLFQYIYEDLQVQLFNSQTIQIQTFNASELTTEGAEFDLLWATRIAGLSFRAALAITDTTYTEDFVNATGQNLKGRTGSLSADVAGFAGFSYDWVLSAYWRVNFSWDARYNSGYPFTATLDPYTQDDFWRVDTALRLYSSDNRYELALIGRNVTDQIYAMGAGARTGACANAQPAPPGSFATIICNPDPANPANSLDQITTTSLGSQWTLQLRVRL